MLAEHDEGRGVWYGDRLRDDFRRRTPTEANAIFADLGLTGPFWALPD
jgi:hypothetical protein